MPTNLTALCRAARENPARIPELAAAARAAARPHATPYRRAPRAALFTPGAAGARFGDGSGLLPTDPNPPFTPKPPAPLATLPVPALDVDLRAAALAAVQAVTTAHGGYFEGAETALLAFRALAEANVDPDADNTLRVPVDRAAERMLNTFSGDKAVPAACATLATRLVALLHAERHGDATPNVALDAGGADRALVAADWFRRREAGPAVPAIPPPTQPDPEPAAVTGTEPDANTPDAATPPQAGAAAVAVEHPGRDNGMDADAKRLLALLTANTGAPTTVRDLGRRLKLPADRVREIVTSRPDLFQAALGTKSPGTPKGGRPGHHVALNPAADTSAPLP